MINTESANNSFFLKVDMVTDQDDERPVRIVGDFNDWKHETAIPMQKIGAGKYSLELKLPAFLKRKIKYKYLKGSWDDVETDQWGNETSSRNWNAKDTVIEDRVMRWKRNGKTYRKEFLPLIEIISENFEMPQLIKTRRVAALLPHDYYRNQKRYPVLYLQDGQNLFDDYAPYGSWALDKKLAIMAEKGFGDFIVVAIDHAEEQRISEYTPSHQTKLGMGDGKKYVQFLSETLKPFIDKNFRTLTDQEHTGIGGSSMGGLVSLYAGLLYPNIYSKLLVFSPSLWVDPDILLKTVHFDMDRPLKLYLYAGEDEGPNVVSNTRKLKRTLSDLPQFREAEINLSLNPHGKHQEKFWGKEFPKAAKWLFFNNKK